MTALTSFAAVGADKRDPLTGLWMVKDERTGAPRALIRIAEREGEYVGTIERGLLPEDRRQPVCDKCPDARRGQPLLGMAILTGMRREGNAYGGGEILDPDTGQVYRCIMAVREGGRRLEVRGFVGVPLLGRTQVWYRYAE